MALQEVQSYAGRGGYRQGCLIWCPFSLRCRDNADRGGLGCADAAEPGCPVSPASSLTRGLLCYHPGPALPCICDAPTEAAAAGILSALARGPGWEILDWNEKKMLQLLIPLLTALRGRAQEAPGLCQSKPEWRMGRSLQPLTWLLQS